jgi:phytanoyl-CoA hydroxylase
MADVQALKAEFNEKGYLHLAKLVDPGLCEKLIFRMRELVANKAHSQPKALFEAGEDNHSKDHFFLNSARKISFFFDPKAQLIPRRRSEDPFYTLNKVGHALHDQCPVYQKFSHQPRFYELMRTLGHRSPKLIQSMFIFKQSGFGDGVPSHQDASFIYTEPNSVIGLWFALEDAEIENGCLWALPGGHRGELKHRFVKNTQGLEFIEQKSVSWPKEKFKPLCAKQGDVIVLHGLLPHFSEQNRSSRTRYAYSLHFVEGRAYYPKNNWLEIS